MKKGFTLLTLIAFLSLGNFSVFAQDSTNTQDTTTEVINSEETTTEITEDNSSEEEIVKEDTFHQIIKQKFMEGGPAFMGIVLLCLILGLALAIERIIYLNN